MYLLLPFFFLDLDCLDGISALLGTERLDCEYEIDAFSGLDNMLCREGRVLGIPSRSTGSGLDAGLSGKE